MLGASNFSFAYASWAQQLPDWIDAQVRMFEYFGCVPALVVPDNLKSAIHKSCRYEPDTNPVYNEFIAHYNTAIPFHVELISQPITKQYSILI